MKRPATRTTMHAEPHSKTVGPMIRWTTRWVRLLVAGAARLFSVWDSTGYGVAVLGPHSAESEETTIELNQPKMSLVLLY